MPWAQLVLTDVWRLTFWDLLVWEGEEIGVGWGWAEGDRERERG